MPGDKSQQLSFFDKPFQEQVEAIIKTGDLKSLQALIGIRNPIALLQYYASLIVTKINIMYAKLYGEYETMERCLTQYQKDHLLLGYNNEAADVISFFSNTIQDINEKVEEELCTNHIFLPSSKKELDSISNVSYVHSLDQGSLGESLIDYVRSTDITNICSMNYKQVVEIYSNFTCKAEELLKSFFKHYMHNRKQIGTDVSYELSSIHVNIDKYKEEINKYQEYLKKIKDRSFLNDWYTILIYEIENDAQDIKHTLHTMFASQKYSSVAGLLRNQFINKVLEETLQGIVFERYGIVDDRNLAQLNLLQEIAKPAISKLRHNILDPDRFIEAIKNVLSKETKKYDNQSLIVISDLIIDKIRPEMVVEAEQKILDYILIKAVKEKQQDLALLLICNGADIDLVKDNLVVRKELDNEVLKNAAFLVVKELYDKMPSIKIRVFEHFDLQLLQEFTTEPGLEEAGSKRTILKEEKTLEIENIFALPEIKEAFPQDTTIGKTASSLAMYDKGILQFKEQVSNKEQVLLELKRKFNETIKKTIKWRWQILLATAPLLALGVIYFAVPFGACMLAGLSDLGIKWRSKHNAENDLEIAQKDLGKVVKIFEDIVRSLQFSTVAGGGILIEKIQKIKQEVDNIKNSRKEWVNISEILKAFEELEEIAKDSNKKPKVKTFEELASNIIKNRQDYIKKLKGVVSNQAIVGQAISGSDQSVGAGSSNTNGANMNTSTIGTGIKGSNGTEQQEQISTKEAIIAAEAKAEEAEAKAEGERAAREEAEARSKATGNMFSEAAIIGIVDKVVSDQKLQEFLIDQFKLVELYKGLKGKCKNLVCEYVKLSNELTDCKVIVDSEAQNPEEISKEDIFERRSSLVKKSDKLGEKLKKLNEEYTQEKPTFENEKIEEFKNDTLIKVTKAKEDAENLRQMLQAEQERVEADKLQAQAEEVPDSNMSKAEIQSHQNTASKIA